MRAQVGPQGTGPQGPSGTHKGLATEEPGGPQGPGQQGPRGARKGLGRGGPQGSGPQEPSGAHKGLATEELGGPQGPGPQGPRGAHKGTGGPLRAHPIRATLEHTAKSGQLPMGKTTGEDMLYIYTIKACLKIQLMK